MRRAALLPLIVLATCATTTVQAPPFGELIAVKMSESWLGFATCRTRPTAWVRADVMLTDEGPQVLAHELEHARHYASFGSCEAFTAWAESDPRNRMESEARAFCASVLTDTRSGRLKWERALNMYAARLAYGYPFGLTPAEAEAEIRVHCTTNPADL